MSDDDLTSKKRTNGNNGFYEWSPVFLKALAYEPNVSRAARKAGVSRQTVYHHRGNNDSFRAAWDMAIEVGVDRLEEEMWRRAVQGVHRYKFHNGERITIEVLDEETGEVKDVPYVEHEYSDTLAIFLAKAHRPEKFRERYDVTTGGSPLESNVHVYLPDNGRDDD